MNSMAPEMMALSEALGQLHTLVSEGQRESRDARERSDRLALERHDKLELRVTGLWKAHDTLTRQSDHLAREIKDLREKSGMTARTVQEHMGADENTMTGLRTHLSNTDSTLAIMSERMGNLNTTTKDQNTVLDTQTGLLQDQAKWAKVRTILVTVGAGVGAAIASYLTARGH